MLKIKIYKYDSTQESNGYRGTDYSAYVLQGFQDTEDITQELDTSEITLCGLTQAKEFDPETKFIIDFVKIDTESNEIIQNTLHRVVARDMVSQPILSDETYYDHHISLIEPSVIAQKRLVDNISATYKLKDVSLQEQVSYDLNQDASMYNDPSVYTPSNNFGYREEQTPIGGTARYSTWGKYFEYEGSIEMQPIGGTASSKTYQNIEDFEVATDDYQAKFTIPKLAIYAGQRNAKTFTKIGYASLDYRIEEYFLNDSSTVKNSWTGNIISKSNLYNYQDGVYRPNNASYEQNYRNEWLDESHDNGQYYYQIRKYTDTRVSVPEPVYETQTIPIRKDCQYKITISLHQFDDNVPSGSWATKYTGSPTLLAIFDDYNYPTSPHTYTTTTTLSLPSQTQMTTEFITYSQNSISIVYASAIPYSALALLQKAILNSSLYEKKSGVYIADVNNSDLPFTIDENYLEKLSTTRVIENFYNQKNLWEIMVEVGHYIHAIPELRFGADDKFEITFNELGRTDQHIDSATKVSIYNSRSVEDYISATSSYVSNMVQLGGYVQEWVAPKTSDDTLLIANDTANLLTSKPIIELLEIQVKSNVAQTIGDITLTAGQTADLTPYIYEENVYKTLSIDYKIKPNRGIGMYYRLGTNEITGGQYRLPRPSYDIYNDYTFKKIIYCAFYGSYPVVAQIPMPSSGYWTDLKVNDFSFLIKYRTKDTVRQNHVRPDLRKYILNSKYDKYPEHNQFNNQQDILVDSIKFGNNVYGKLIKTGNSEYTKQEWVDDYDNVKHKGELYNINGSLYYVAQITNTYYADHIVSEVKFSKDYNELSAVIGIPSEPRFYEISEQSSIQREVAINDLILLTDDDVQADYPGHDQRIPNYLYTWSHLKNLLFGNGGTFAKYALTVFKGDEDVGTYDQTVGQPNFYKEVFTPINAYSSENTLTYEWDMADNFSAGDKVVATEQSGTTSINSGNYNSLWAVPYTDIYGKSALMDFFILSDLSLGTNAIKALPESPVSTVGYYWGEYDTTTMPTDAELAQFLAPYRPLGARLGDMIKVVVDDGTNIPQIFKYIYAGATDGWQYEAVSNTYQFPTGGFLRTYEPPIIATNKKYYNLNFNSEGLGLLKDCREIISCNYNLQMVTDSDTFVLSPFMFLPDKQNMKIVLLSEEINKFTDGYIDESKIITPLDTNDQTLSPYFNVNSGSIFDFHSGWTTKTASIQDAYYGIRVYLGRATPSDYVLSNVNEHHFDGTDGYQQVKAIAIICDVNQNPSTDTSGVNTIIGKKQFTIARNIPSTFTKEQAIHNWYIVTPTTDYFTNKQ